MKALIISLMLGFSQSAMAETGDELVGIWAEPSKANPDTIWYLHKDGKAIASTNAFFKNLHWFVEDGKLFITDEKTDGHTWEARYHKSRAKGVHSYTFENGLNVVRFYAEKISDNPNKPIDFYTVCSNMDGAFEVVNTGRFEKCQSFVPMEIISSFYKQEAKVLCESLIKIRKKEGREETCLSNLMKNILWLKCNTGNLYA